MFGFKRIGGLALALVMACAGTAAASTPFNLGPGFKPDIKIDATGRAHVGWIEARAENAEAPSQVHYCRLAAATETCEAKALGGPSEIGNYPKSIASPLEIFLNPDGKPRIFVGCYNCDHGGAQTSELIVEASGTSMARRTSGADPEGGGMVGNIRTTGKSAYDATTGRLYGTDLYDFQAMPTADPSDDAPTRLSPFPGGSGYDGAVGVAGTGPSQVQVAAYLGRASGETGSRLRFLTHVGADGVNTAANWQGGSSSIGYGNELAMESAGANVSLLTTAGSGEGGVFVHFRRFDVATRSFGDPVTIASPTATGDKGPERPDLFQAPNGRLYAAWTDSGRIRFSSSTDGATWSFPETVVNDALVEDLRIAGAGEADKGLVVWATNEHDDGVVKAAALSPALAMACPGDPRCPAPQQPQQPPQPPAAPPRAVVKKGTLGQLKYAIRAPTQCVPRGARVHISLALGKRKLTKAQKKKLAGKAVKLRSLSLWRGGKRLALRKKSPLDGYEDSAGFNAAAIVKYQLRIVYRVGKSKKNRLKKITVNVRIC